MTVHEKKYEHIFLNSSLMVIALQPEAFLVEAGELLLAEAGAEAPVVPAGAEQVAVEVVMEAMGLHCLIMTVMKMGIAVLLILIIQEETIP